MVNVSGWTHIGRRDNNEDSFFVGKNFAVVADGMGGHNKGEVASKTAVECIQQQLKPLTRVSQKNILDAVNFANDEIFNKSLENDLMQDMGTTVVMCAWNRSNVVAANVGDSRCYLISDNTIKRITTDHSYVQSLIDSGEITELEAETRPDKNVILRAVGCEKNIETDIFKFSVNPGDKIVLCSDGLSGVLPADDIKDVVNMYDDAECAAKALVNKAYEDGGTDNITAVVIMFE